MSATGNSTQNPTRKPRRSCSGHGAKPGTAAAQGGGSSPESLTNRPLITRTPVPGAAANARNRASPTRAQPVTRSSASGITGRHIAPATADVVFPGGSADRTRTRMPASARQTAEVSPITPAPTTTTSARTCNLLGSLPSLRPWPGLGGPARMMYQIPLTFRYHQY